MTAGCSPDETLSIAHPGLLEAISVPGNMVVWEALRRFRRAATVAEVHESTSIPVQTIQTAIDALHSVTLVERVPAGRGSRVTRWKCDRERIYLTYRRDRPEEEALQRRMQTLFDATTTDLRAKVKPRATRTIRDFHWNSVHATRLSAPELNEIYDILQRLFGVLAKANSRVHAAAPSEPVESNYLVSIDVEPLVAGVLPLPSLQCIGSTSDTGPAIPGGLEADAKLTARERDVAVLLSRGVSRAEVGRELGISPHTVTEFTRRIYRKLGVNNRARLAAKLAAAPGF
jgi:DNA-binding CsgD family transcriptional regulator